MSNMDEFDAPRKMPVENLDVVPDLNELQRQTCQLFEEFLLLDDPVCRLLDEPLPASYDDLKEQADSPIQNFSYKMKPEPKPRGLLCGISLDDDVVSDSATEPSPVQPSAARFPVEQEEKDELETDNKMKTLAFELAKAGDALVVEYGTNVKNAEGKLLQLVKQEATNLTYDRFSTAIDDLVGKDKNWTNFVFAFCVGRRVCKHTQEVADFVHQRRNLVPQ